MSSNTPYFGSPLSRVDGKAKVTGEAKYAAEFTAPGLLHGVVVSSGITRGKIAAIDTAAALAVPGVVQVFTHENRPRTAWRSKNYQDDVAPPGSPFRALYDAEIHYSGQPVALVVAEDFSTARHAAMLVQVRYEEAPHATDVAAVRGAAYVPPKKRSGIAPPPPPRGDAEKALDAAPHKVAGEYRIAIEHHNPMEPHATTVVWEGDGRITVHDKIQGAQNSQKYVSNVFGLSADKVRVISPFVGGAFGSGLRPQYQLFLAVMAALELERSVRVVLSREQMFTFGYRPDVLQDVSIGAAADGVLQAIRHEAISGTSQFEDYQEVVVNWSGLLYHCENVALDYKLAKIDTYTPCDMRAPGGPTGLFALESALDELAYALKADPLELRLRNYAEKDENEGKPFTSKELRAAYREGAERFGWSRRSPEPRSMREGRELIGWGVASGVWEAQMMKTSARATLTADGKLEVATATADIGTGTYTILTQIGADALGLGMEDVTAKIGDSSLPTSPVEGGSWTAASAGSAVLAACDMVRARLLGAARGLPDSPLAGAAMEDVSFANGRIGLSADPLRSLPLTEVMRAAGLDRIEEEQTASPSKEMQKTYSSYTHSAVFAEVRVDEELGVIRVTRIVDAVAAGRIINPKTARSQIIGGVVWGMSMALTEESLQDHNLGRFMNHNLAEYHVPVNADVHDIDVIFVQEDNDKGNPLGVKGLGEIGICGTAAAIANAVFHATGKRIRSLPITVDKLLGDVAVPAE
ncbi:Xanthine dehydrogenase molybdenum-binding subunit [Roseomonas sp. TAS13]|uniref:xanthine dehydrogenase family protein molybdopterin-binding subunit n=1 Tax=Roseomonas sp. TAS13 TaxID=1926319 RepID=UPI00096823BA|nr:xanthine dehydrogenase family protein molybdopterin-binding subunit [Roseomonas sp. TAS13]GAV35002.1 Xanthine dehydrogenase molybdenum-binding subunit [Roseomonas sp. TAS13]